MRTFSCRLDSVHTRSPHLLGDGLQVCQGAIVEQGTLKELMAIPDGSYVRLVSAEMRDKGSTQDAAAKGVASP